MALFNWQNGNKTQNAVVTSDGVTVQDAVWEGETPLSASNLNAAQNQLVEYVEGKINSNLGTETNTWSSASSYSAGARVIYEGGTYKNLTGNNSSAPNIDTTNWEAVPFISSNGYFNEDISQDKYSSNEIKTGKKWIDGKDIYRVVKVDNQNISGGAGDMTAGNFAISTNARNIETLIKFEGYMYETNSTNIRSINQAGYGGANERIGALISNYSNGTISGRTAWPIYKEIIILEYTKSS